MTKISIALIMTFLLASCGSKHRSILCVQFDGSRLDDERVELSNDKAQVLQTQTGIHDTLAVDLIVLLKDQ